MDRITRPNQDEVRFNVEMQRLSPVADGKGGYVLYDSYSHPRFHVLAPTVHDAAGKQGHVTLELSTNQAVIKVDPAFLTTATYPVTVDPTVNWTISSPATTFEYDRYAPVAQLTAVAALQGPESHSSYDYSERHNRLERVQGPTQPTNQQVTTAYTYDRADRLLTATGLTYTVNKNGNLRERSGGSICDTFSYDQANRMTAANVNSCGTSTTSSYSYNGDGLRITKTVGGGSTTRYVWDVNRGLPTILEDGTRKYVWGAQGLSHNVAISGGAVEVYHADQIGTVRELTSGSDGTLVQTYTHDEYGVPTQATGSSGQPFRYTGEPWDGGSGEPNLLYLRTRFYEPGAGRFMSRDLENAAPCSDQQPGRLNKYTYTENNPINRVDPLGTQSLPLELPPPPFQGCRLVSKLGFFGLSFLSLECSRPRPKPGDDPWCEQQCGIERQSCLTEAGADPNEAPWDDFGCWSGYYQCLSTGGYFENPGWRRKNPDDIFRFVC